jgi:hypothetical protein
MAVVLKRVVLSITTLVVVGGVFGAATIFAWMVDETHFDRPDARFDRLTAELGSEPGVSVDGKERWVEAPTFSDPTSWIHLTVEADHLPGLLDSACAERYPDAVTWSLRVPTNNGSTVSLYTGATSAERVDGPPCPDFGFDAVGLVEEVGRSLPRMNLQATVWDDGRFALTLLDDYSGTLSELLPLVDRADEVRAAAGLDPDRSVQIDSASLSAHILAEEHDRYLALLTDLAENHGVTSYWADGGGTPVDGVEKVQIAAPDGGHEEIEDLIRSSGLHVAEFPVRFLPSTP